ncbi:MAG: VanZ family protein [Ruminococcus sp.]|nr:VanZ family protein [Ruminococcus sp.]
MNILMRFYIQPMDMVFLEMALMFTAWTVFITLLKGKVKRYTALFFAAAAVIGILLTTVLRRQYLSNYDVNFIPFYTFVAAKTQPELYRTMVMNVFLFMPLGMSMPFALGEKAKRKVIITVISALALSVAVELVQLALSRGMCDIDDVICNTLGAFLGSVSFIISSRISKFIDKHKTNRG